MPEAPEMIGEMEKLAICQTRPKAPRSLFAWMRMLRMPGLGRSKHGQCCILAQRLSAGAPHPHSCCSFLALTFIEAKPTEPCPKHVMICYVASFLTPLAYATLRAWSSSLRDHMWRVCLRRQLTQPHACGDLAYAQVDLDAAQLVKQTCANILQTKLHLVIPKPDRGSVQFPKAS